MEFFFFAYIPQSIFNLIGTMSPYLILPKMRTPSEASIVLSIYRVTYDDRLRGYIQGRRNGIIRHPWICNGMLTLCIRLMPSEILLTLYVVRGGGNNKY